MTTPEILAHPRFRQAVRAGEYTRAIAVYLVLQFPGVDDISTIPREQTQAAREAVDKAFFDREVERKEMEKEMR